MRKTVTKKIRNIMNKIAYLEGYLYKTASVGKPGIWRGLMDVLSAKQMRSGMAKKQEVVNIIKDFVKKTKDDPFHIGDWRAEASKLEDTGAEAIRDILVGGAKTGATYAVPATAIGTGATLYATS